ncbi:MAG: TonB-dependent receptor [Saprospiraceae bacterium]|nr:TonB-dependent receptor [Saprospiraceae bacterium]
MKKFLILFALVWCSVSVTWAQRNVQGQVTDENGEPLIGATILVEGTSTGTATDASGEFTLSNLPAEASRFLVSFTGYNSQSIALTNESYYRVSLEPGATALQDVVVIGYGTASRKELTGAVSRVSGETISKLPVTGLDQALQGQAAGVFVTTSSGTPGSSVALRIRGVASITGSSQPLFVIDGVPINTGSYSQIGFGNQTTNALADINPSDIESIEVLKDASSAAIYGSRASNGVVLITTKRGKNKKTTVSINTYYGTQEAWNTIPTTTGPEYVALVQEAIVNRFGAGRLPSQSGLRNLDSDPSTYPTTDWQAEIFQTAPISQTDVSFAGGDEKTKFYVSGSYFTQDGTIKGSSFNRYSFRTNLENLVSKRLKFGLNTSFSRSNSNRLNNDNNIFGVLSTAVLLGSHIPVFNADGTYGKDPNSSVENPVAAYREPTNENFSNRLLSSIYGEYSIMDGLTFRSSVNVDYVYFREFRFNPTTTNAGAGTNGTGIEAFNAELNLVNENYFNYAKNFGKFGINALAGISFQNSQQEFFFGQGENFPGNTIKTLNAASIKRDVTSGRTEWGLNSYYSRLVMNWDQKYYLSGSARYDGSSRFGENNRWGLFPAVSGAWRISQESFLRDNKIISELKIKAGWGLRGNQEIGNFSSRALISAGTNYLQRAGLAPTQLGNPDLTWEEREDIDLGLEIGLFDSRIELLAELYRGTTRELLLNRPLVGSSGFTGITENIGSIVNEGLDITFRTLNVNKEKFTWSTSLNLSFFRNEIETLAGTPFAAGFASWVEEGQPLGAFRGFEVVKVLQTQAEIDALNTTAKERTGNSSAVYQSSLTRPGDLMFLDINEDGVITTADQKILGDANPDLFGGITNNISAFGFDLSFFFQFSVGNFVYNNTNAFAEGMNTTFGQFASVRNRWTPENPTENIRYPRAVFGDPNNNRRVSNRFLEDASYLRLKNISLGYRLPRTVLDRLQISNARFYVTGQNLLTFTEYSGFDPEVSTFAVGNAASNTAPGTDFLTFPQARVMIAGLNLEF